MSSWVDDKLFFSTRNSIRVGAGARAEESYLFSSIDLVLGDSCTINMSLMYGISDFGVDALKILQALVAVDLAASGSLCL